MDALAEIAIDAARTGGAQLLECTRRDNLAPLAKPGPRDIVTAADRASESAIIAVITQARKADGIVSEEGASHASGGNLTWVLDPLDGTM